MKEKRESKPIDVGEVIWNFIESKKSIIFFIVITIVAILIRSKLIFYESHDMTTCLKPWFFELRDYGGFAGLSREIGNYNPPYLTILAILTYIPALPLVSIKVVSIIFDFVCAIAVGKIVKIIFKNKKDVKIYSLMAYAITLFLPTVILNSACWGQADSIYTAFILFSIMFLLEKKYLRSFILLGISFAFKLQFVFILPLFIYVYISERKFPIYYFLIIPLINILMCVPAMIAGRSFLSCMEVYFGQTQMGFNYLSMNFPGIWNLFMPYLKDSYYIFMSNQSYTQVGIYVTIAVLGIMAFMVLYKKIKFNKQKIIEFGLWSVLITTYLLPFMHDRYLYIADILSIIYFIYNKDKLYVPLGINFISSVLYGIYLFKFEQLPFIVLTLINTAIVILVTKDLIKKYFINNEKNVELEKSK